MRLQVLDLFSGIGGFSLGLERTGGFETSAFCEINPFCRAVLAKHWPGVPIHQDVKDMEHDGPVHVITSGDPCQRDSRANAQRDGASLWPYAFAQVRRHKPLFVLRENVSGNIDTGTLERVESDLRSEGYRVRSYLIHASALGAAHDRPRTWTLAHTDSAGCEEFDHAAVTGSPEEWEHTLHAGPHGLYWMGSESPVLRRADDVPHRLDRIRALGNTVDPRIPEMFGRAMLQYLALGRDAA